MGPYLQFGKITQAVSCKTDAESRERQTSKETMSGVGSCGQGAPMDTAGRGPRALGDREASDEGWR